MFDLGSLDTLSSKDLLKLTHVFVSHTHMDHFIGFDSILRIFLGREKKLHLFGPPDFFQQVEGKLRGYTWNLVDEYPNDLKLRISEVHSENIYTKEYLCREQFSVGIEKEVESFSKVILKEPSFRVEAALLDHKIPCLGFSLIENFYVNIMKDRLMELNLEVGSWINRFKAALYDNQDPETVFPITFKGKGNTAKKIEFKLGDLKDNIALISPGQKITYISDVIGSHENQKKILDLAKDSDHLFIEAAFLDRDKGTARKKYHLTAREAGELARQARAKRFTIFHFSPRYSGIFEEIRKEAMEAFLNL